MPSASAMAIITEAGFEAMNSQIMLIIVGIVASVFLGAVSNWIYDLLKNKGIFPHRPTVKAVIVVVLASVPFVLLIALPEIPGRDRAALLAVLQTSIPLWGVLASVASAFFLGYLMGRRERSEDLEERLKNSERMLDHYLRPEDRRPQSRIIRPPR